MNKANINDSLDIVRKNIFFMTKMNTKHNIIKNNMSKKIRESQKKKDEVFNVALVPNPNFNPEKSAEKPKGGGHVAKKDEQDC